MKTKKNKKRDDSSAELARYKHGILILYAVIIAVCTIGLSETTFSETDSLLKSKVLEMSSQLNMQMQINLENYLQRVETLGTLSFAQPLNYTYDDTCPPADEYEALKQRDAISENLFNICMMENFVDFGIVYSNNNFVGKISNGSLNAFGDDMYYDLEEMITRPATSDGWFTGFEGNYRRIYYVKRIHKNALLVLSFYSSELSHVFEHSQSGGMESLAVRLLEKDDVVIYSNINNETGLKLEESLLSRVNKLENESTIDDMFLVSSNSAGDWRVVCSMPTEKILFEKQTVQNRMISAAVVSAILAIALTVFILNKLFMTRINDVVSDLDDQAHKDLLTGILNKRSFEKFTETAIAASGIEDKGCLILIDLDNFKGVNDTLGHEYGDRVLSGVGDILRNVFSENDLLGRLGGDEFCVFLNTGSENSEKYADDKCRELCRAFSTNYTGENNDYKISASIGVSFCPKHGVKFADLYRRADKALYFSKHHGKDTYTMFTSDMEEVPEE